MNRLNGWNINDDIEFWNQYNNPQPQAAHLTQKALACKNCKAVLFKVNERLFEEADNILVFKIEVIMRHFLFQFIYSYLAQCTTFNVYFQQPIFQRTVTFDDGFRYVRYDSPAFSLGRGNVLGRGRGRGSGRVFMGSFERDGYYRQAELPGWRCANCSAELSNYIPTVILPSFHNISLT